MRVVYSIEERVRNGYEVTGISKDDLEKELSKDSNIWSVQQKLALDGINIQIELIKPCYDFYESYFDKYEVYNY